MKHQQLEKIEGSYQELRQQDYLDEIDIVDDSEIPTTDHAKGLSEEQVSQIAKDSLERSIKFDSDAALSSENDQNIGLQLS